jgi:hypothetical protein
MGRQKGTGNLEDLAVDAIILKSRVVVNIDK